MSNSIKTTLVKKLSLISVKLTQTLLKIFGWSITMKMLAATLAIATMMVFTGCNTVKGIGKDVSRAGTAVTDSAEKTQDKMYN